TYSILAALLCALMYCGQAFADTDEENLDNVVNSVKSNSQLHKKEKSPAVEAGEGTNYVVIPFAFNVIPIKLGGIKTIDNLEINLGAGYSDILKGTAVGFVNITGEDGIGVDASFVSITGGNFEG